MTRTPQRSCATCAHFGRGEDACTGWCTHPRRQSETDARIYVRDRELACRVGWARDFWELREDDEPGVPVHVFGLRVWGPFQDETALDDLPGDLLGWLLRAGVD